MKIIITIPDEKEQEIFDAFCSAYRYENIVTKLINKKLINLSKHQTKKEFTLEKIQKYIKDVYESYKLKEVESTTKQTTIEIAKVYTNDFTIT